MGRGRAWRRSPGLRVACGYGSRLLSAPLWAPGGRLAILMNWTRCCPATLSCRHTGWGESSGRFPLPLPLTRPGKPRLGPVPLRAFICCVGSQSAGSSQETFRSRLTIKARTLAEGFGVRDGAAPPTGLLSSHPRLPAPRPAPPHHPRAPLLLIKRSPPASPGLRETHISNHTWNWFSFVQSLV